VTRTFHWASPGSAPVAGQRYAVGANKVNADWEVTVVNRRDTGQRRAPGALESAVMAILWAADRALSPSEVQAELDGDLAYNTVQTILTRLHDKGLVARVPSRRGHAYRPLQDAATTAARQMQKTLAHQADRHEVLLHFAEGLEPEDVRVLRELLAGFDADRAAEVDGHREP
jgi:predicted transcriptional regulator